VGNSKTREVVIPVALAVALGVVAVSGGIVWGQTQQRLTAHEERLNKQDLINEKVQQIWRKQSVLETQIDNVGNQQRRNFEATQRTLTRILARIPLPPPIIP